MKTIYVQLYISLVFLLSVFTFYGQTTFTESAASFGNIVYDYTHDGSRASEAKWWDGISTGRWTLSKDSKVPVGTYFYILNPNVKVLNPKQVDCI